MDLALRLCAISPLVEIVEMKGGLSMFLQVVLKDFHGLHVPNYHVFA